MSTVYVAGLLNSGGTLAIALGPGVSQIAEADAILAGLLNGNEVHGRKAAKTNGICIITSDQATATALNVLRQHHPEDQSTLVIAPAGPMRADFLSHDGLALLAQMVPSTSRIGVVVVSPASKKAVLQGRNLQDLANLVRGRCDAAIVIFGMAGERDRPALADNFQHLLCADVCEPDRDYSAAYIVRTMPGTYLEAVGHPTVVENYRLKAGGSYERNCYPSAIPSALTREIFRLVESGKTLAAVGKAVGLDKSTVSRRLSALPFGSRRRFPVDE